MKPMNILNKLVKSKGVMLVRKYSPEILTGVGIVSGVASTVVACKATLRVEEVLEERNVNMKLIEQAKNAKSDDYSDGDAVKDKVIAQAQMVGGLARLYAPAVGLGALSVASILGSYGIMKKRNVALVAAYSVVSTKFKEYRERVTEEYGKDKDRQFYHGLKSETISVKDVDENGKKKTVKQEVYYINPEITKSPYARFFDEASRRWVNDAEMNLMFLTAQQNYANEALRRNGHLFLNEVYDILGIPRSKEGAVVGWVYDGDGDNFVDFDIYCPYNQASRDFVNGHNPAILLDFNVDGVIYDLI